MTCGIRLSAAPGAGHLTLPNVTGTDIFCSSQLVLAQSGNIFLAGGDNFVNGTTTNTGNNNSNVFNARSTTRSARGNNMNRARWYSTSTTLVNGEIYIQGGSGGGDRPEVRDDRRRVPPALERRTRAALTPTFPRNFLAPDGRVFGFDTSGKMYYVTPGGTGLLEMAGQLPGATSWTSSAVMFQPGRILQMGGASSAAVVIDINGAHARRHFDAVDVHAAPVGVRDGACRWPRARHGRQHGRESAQRREQRRGDLEPRHGPVDSGQPPA